ncbi:uncharacterized protein [Apostichopus japonicus]|uniref:uncharacterized protein n=1 Tax=Stichopus japonicus TaxID=307972 RepID=UPI003AB83D65
MTKDVKTQNRQTETADSTSPSLKSTTIHRTISPTNEGSRFLSTNIPEPIVTKDVTIQNLQTYTREYDSATQKLDAVVPTTKPLTQFVDSTTEAQDISEPIDKTSLSSTSTSKTTERNALFESTYQPSEKPSKSAQSTTNIVESTSQSLEGNIQYIDGITYIFEEYTITDSLPLESNTPQIIDTSQQNHVNTYLHQSETTKRTSQLLKSTTNQRKIPANEEGSSLPSTNIPKTTMTKDVRTLNLQTKNSDRMFPSQNSTTNLRTIAATQEGSSLSYTKISTPTMTKDVTTLNLQTDTGDGTTQFLESTTKQRDISTTTDVIRNEGTYKLSDRISKTDTKPFEITTQDIDINTRSFDTNNESGQKVTREYHSTTQKPDAVVTTTKILTRFVDSTTETQDISEPMEKTSLSSKSTTDTTEENALFERTNQPSEKPSKSAQSTTNIVESTTQSPEGNIQYIDGHTYIFEEYTITDSLPLESNTPQIIDTTQQNHKSQSTTNILESTSQSPESYIQYIDGITYIFEEYTITDSLPLESNTPKVKDTTQQNHVNTHLHQSETTERSSQFLESTTNQRKISSAQEGSSLLSTIISKLTMTKHVTTQNLQTETDDGTSQYYESTTKNREISTATDGIRNKGTITLSDRISKTDTKPFEITTQDIEINTRSFDTNNEPGQRATREYDSTTQKLDAVVRNTKILTQVVDSTTEAKEITAPMERKSSKSTTDTTEETALFERTNQPSQRHSKSAQSTTNSIESTTQSPEGNIQFIDGITYIFEEYTITDSLPLESNTPQTIDTTQQNHKSQSTTNILESASQSPEGNIQFTDGITYIFEEYTITDSLPLESNTPRIIDTTQQIHKSQSTSNILESTTQSPEDNIQYIDGITYIFEENTITDSLPLESNTPQIIDTTQQNHKSQSTTNILESTTQSPEGNIQYIDGITYIFEEYTITDSLPLESNTPRIIDTTQQIHKSQSTTNILESTTQSPEDNIQYIDGITYIFEENTITDSLPLESNTPQIIDTTQQNHKSQSTTNILESTTQSPEGNIQYIDGITYIFDEYTITDSLPLKSNTPQNKDTTQQNHVNLQLHQSETTESSSQVFESTRNQRKISATQEGSSLSTTIISKPTETKDVRTLNQQTETADRTSQPQKNTKIHRSISPTKEGLNLLSTNIPKHTVTKDVTTQNFQTETAYRTSQPQISTTNPRPISPTKEGPSLLSSNIAKPTVTKDVTTQNFQTETAERTSPSIKSTTNPRTIAATQEGSSFSSTNIPKPTVTEDVTSQNLKTETAAGTSPSLQSSTNHRTITATKGNSSLSSTKISKPIVTKDVTTQKLQTETTDRTSPSLKSTTNHRTIAATQEGSSFLSTNIPKPTVTRDVTTQNLKTETHERMSPSLKSTTHHRKISPIQEGSSLSSTKISKPTMTKDVKTKNLQSATAERTSPSSKSTTNHRTISPTQEGPISLSTTIPKPTMNKGVTTQNLQSETADRTSQPQIGTTNHQTIATNQEGSSLSSTNIPKPTVTKDVTTQNLQTDTRDEKPQFLESTTKQREHTTTKDSMRNEVTIALSNCTSITDTKPFEITTQNIEINTRSFDTNNGPNQRATREYDSTTQKLDAVLRTTKILTQVVDSTTEAQEITVPIERTSLSSLSTTKPTERNTLFESTKQPSEKPSKSAQGTTNSLESTAQSPKGNIQYIDGITYIFEEYTITDSLPLESNTPHIIDTTQQIHKQQSTTNILESTTQSPESNIQYIDGITYIFEEYTITDSLPLESNRPQVIDTTQQNHKSQSTTNILESTSQSPEGNIQYIDGITYIYEENTITDSLPLESNTPRIIDTTQQNHKSQSTTNILESTTQSPEDNIQYIDGITYIFEEYTITDSLPLESNTRQITDTTQQNHVNTHLHQSETTERASQVFESTTNQRKIPANQEGSRLPSTNIPKPTMTKDVTERKFQINTGDETSQFLESTTKQREIATAQDDMRNEVTIALSDRTSITDTKPFEITTQNIEINTRSLDTNNEPNQRATREYDSTTRTPDAVVRITKILNQVVENTTEAQEITAAIERTSFPSTCTTESTEITTLFESTNQPSEKSSKSSKSTTKLVESTSQSFEGTIPSTEGITQLIEESILTDSLPLAIYTRQITDTIKYSEVETETAERTSQFAKNTMNQREMSTTYAQFLKRTTQNYGSTTQNLQSITRVIGSTDESITNRIEDFIGKNSTMTNCLDVYNAGNSSTGIYSIKPFNWSGSNFEVFCNMTTNGGGWTVFQRRVDGSVDFFRNWTSYKYGFGDLDHEFWLGNDKLYYLTNQGDYQLRIDMVNRLGDIYFVNYDFFRISDEKDYYQLSGLGTASGTVGGDSYLRASFGTHLHTNFSTFDQDNDRHTGENCAFTRRGAWWYKQCGRYNLNGDYNAANKNASIRWFEMPGGRRNIKYVEMKIRPV